MNIYTQNIKLPFGSFHILSDGKAVTHLYTGTAEETDTCPVLEAAKQQLREYAEGTRQCFDIPVAPHGTAFQQAVWAALQTIPCGESRSYGDIAAKIGKPKAARAVGMACNKNPILIFVPCHRVIGKNGSLTGFAAGMALKEALLNLERNLPLDRGSGQQG